MYSCGPRNAVGNFIEFLKDEGAKSYEIESLSFYSVTLRLVGEGGEVYLTLQPSRTNREDRHRLYEALRDHPERMAKIFREKLSSYLWIFFDLDRFPKEA